MFRCTCVKSKTPINPCRRSVRAEAGPFCREGLRGPAATTNERGFSLPEWLASAPSRRFNLRRKFFPAERTYMKSPASRLPQKFFPSATGRCSTTGLLEQMPRSSDRRASARLARIATSPLRSTVNLTPRHSSALAKSKPGIFQNLVFVAQWQFCLRQLQRRSSHRMAVL